jgi:hypothetical protein
MKARSMVTIDKCIQKKAAEMREARLKQRWISYSEALAQCLRVEARGDSDSTKKSRRSNVGRQAAAAA